MTEEERSFLSRVVENDRECWKWSGATKGNYGYFRGERAHRYSYRLFVGEIPEGKQVRHSCDYTLCVNPAHLLLGTHTMNMNDVAVKESWKEHNLSEAQLQELCDLRKSQPYAIQRRLCREVYGVSFRLFRYLTDEKS